MGQGYRSAAARVGSALLPFLMASAAHAQQAPNVPQPPTREEILRPTQPTQVPGRPRLSVEGGIERAPCALEGEAYRDITFTVNSVVFEELRGLPAEALRPAYQEYIGTTQPVAVI